MKTPMIHARDREVWYNQKTVVAVCGMKVPIPRTTWLPLGQPITCVGCRAILREREKDAAAEATTHGERPETAETKTSTGVAKQS